MGKHVGLIFIGLCSFISTSCVASQDYTIQIPLHKNKRLFIDNLNLSANDFFIAYTSKDIEQRRFAEMYLAGVLDATEGKDWCGYSKALPGAIQEQIYISFKEENKSSLSRRASRTILDILQKILPCGSKL